MKFPTALSLLACLATMASAAPTIKMIQVRDGQQQCDNPGRWVAVVIDVSGSTGATDPDKFRLQGGADIAEYLTSEAKQTATNKADKLDVVRFSDDAKHVIALGDPGAPDVKSKILGIENIGGTNIMAGLQGGLDALANAPQNLGGLVMFTDGIDFKKQETADLVKAAAQKGIRVSWGHLQENHDRQSGGFFKGLTQGLMSAINGFSVALTGGNGLSPLISQATLQSGGIVSIISSAQAQKDFVQQIIKNGITNNDGKCSSEQPLVENITSLGLCSANGESVFTYTPKKKERVAFAIALTTQNTPVQIQATYLNKATGETKTVNVNRGSAQGTLEGTGAPGQEVVVTIKTSGADNNACQYGITLKTQADNNVPSQVPSSSPAPPPSSSPAPPPSSSQTPIPSSSTEAPIPSSSSAPAPVPTSLTVPAPECPTSSVAPVTVTSTIVETATVSAPKPSSTVCICPCGPDTKPLPKFEL